MQDFSSLGIKGTLVNALHMQNIDTPTPVQERAIPAVLAGKDLIAQAQTGTGKTFAFALPLIQMLDPDAAYTQGLIVTPTRELALQITAEMKKLTDDMEDVEILAVYGGQDVEKQLKKLQRPVQIIVATPGRLLDHVRRGTVDLSKISFLVLDEADQMLHIGFLPEVEDILRELPVTRQTLLFSATISEDVRKLAEKHMDKPSYIQVEKKQGAAASVEQLAIQLTDRAKQGKIVELIKEEQPFMAVIFCRTKRRVSRLLEILKEKGFSVDELHGDLSQAKRERVMKRFRNAELQLLIATDVAARGLDVEGVTHVFNYDIPEDAESYVHRIGRTGRAGMEGKAITFYAPKDKALFESIEKELSLSIPKENLVKHHDEEQGTRPARNNKGNGERPAKPKSFRPKSGQGQKGRKHNKRR